MKPEPQPEPSSLTGAEDRGTTAETRQPPPDTSAPRADSTHLAFDATVAFDSALESSGKEERDILFALATMQSGQINSRQVARSLGNWTIHGHRSLAEHLVNRGVIAAEERANLERVSLKLLADCNVTPGGDLRARLREHVGHDSWEQLCRLLGLASANESADKEAPREAMVEYAIVRRLGIGGLGSVWLAHDQTLKRLVAIKEVNDRGAESPTAMARFRREAEITGQLEHPNIVPVYQSGEDTHSHHPFYVMRFVGKKTLSDAVADYHTRRAAGLADTVELHRLLGAFLSVCQAVAFAHSRGVLHRDLKPENVALGNFGQVIVLDWGLAKRTDDGDWQDSAPGTLSGGSTVEHTMAGQVLGTPHYMSPEQAAGRVECMDERTDVYGLGATLFSILTGYAPHEASQAGSIRSARGAELYAAIVDNPTPRCRDTVPDVPAQLDAICAKAMAAAPAARYAAASDLAEDIQLWMAGEPVSAYQEPGTRQIARLLRKHRGLSILAATVLAAVLIPLAFLGYAANERRAAANQARMESLYLDGKGLSVNLAATAENGRQNVRFMSRIPPIQGIIRARHPDSGEKDDEATWRERMEMIYLGLLRANPEYLRISFCTLGSEANEVVRVERNRFDRTSVEAVVAARLIDLPANAPERQVAALNVGDVAVSELKAPEAVPGTAAAVDSQPLTLHLAVPVHDESNGELFGAVGLEIDLEYLLAKWARDTTASSVLFAGLKGRVMAAFQPESGRDFAWQSDQATSELLAQFAAGRPTELKVLATQDHPGGLFAIKVPIDPRRPQNFVILAVRGG